MKLAAASPPGRPQGERSNAVTPAENKVFGGPLGIVKGRLP